MNLRYCHCLILLLHVINIFPAQSEIPKDLTNIILCVGPAYNKRQQLIETTQQDLEFTPFKAIYITTTDTKNLGIIFETTEPKYLLFSRRDKQLDCLNCILLSLKAVANNPAYADDDIILFKHESVYINDMNLIHKAIAKINDGYDIVCKYWIGFEAEKTAGRLNDYYHTDSFFMKVSAARKLLPYLNEITRFTPDFQFCEEFFTKYIVNQLPRVYKIDYHHSSWKDNELGFYHIPRYDDDPKWYWNKSNYDTLYL